MLKRTLLFLSLTILLIPSLAACGGAQPTTTASNNVLIVAGGLYTTWVRNFNPFNGNPLYPTFSGIYEPLMISNTVKGEIVPWLATGYQWSNGNKTLTFTLHDGVTWSDGQPFTAIDVVYTFDLFKAHAGLQGSGRNATGSGGYVDSVTAPDTKTVVFHFNRVFTPGLYDIMAQDIVPEHIWKNVADLVTYTNPNPVGTGPFTQVTAFQSQVYEVDKNPHYWQPGKPYIKGLRMPIFSSNEQQTVALVNNQIDWSSNFTPNIQQTVISKNANVHYWFPTAGLVVLFELNTTKAPFNDVNVRKAISMAFDRERMVSVALSGYSKPADVTGLSDGYAKWKVPDPSVLGDWTTYNPTKANQMLDAAGYKKGPDGIRLLPNGTPMKFTLTLANGFSDWISAGQIMVPELKAIGIDAEIKMIDPSMLFDVEPKGNFDMTMWFGFQGATPFTLYRNVMSKSTVVPIGQPTFTNFARYSSPKADSQLDQFASTTDFARQKQIVAQLQQIFADEAPVLPLWPAPLTIIYNTAHFTDWPSAENPYAAAMVQGNLYPEQLIIMTTIKPK